MKILVINGSPKGKFSITLQTFKYLEKLHPEHEFSVLDAGQKIKVFEKDEYVHLVCDELEIIHPDVVIQRITGDGARDSLIAPLWSVKKFDVINGVDKELLRRNSYQGIKCKGETK